MERIEIARFRWRDSALEAIDTLHTDFLKQFKRKTNVDLFYREYWKPEEKYPTDRFVVGYVEPKDMDEIIWMKNHLTSE